MDESVYYRYPIDKSYCSFGRSDSNDIRVQIDTVSDMHCKLIRRDDGEVWLKDTSINGTLLNNVLVHDTARPIHHNDVMTIAGRKFRFESCEPAPVTPSETTEVSTPTKIINSIVQIIDDDLQILAEIPSPTSGRTPSTPKNTARNAAALESSLGLFTPNRAAKLSSLLVSPKPIPLPAFLSKSPMKSITPMKSNTPKSTLVMVDEPSVFNVQSSASTSLRTTAPHTPKQEKRKASSMDFDEELGGRTPKKVSFGPALSPEIFDKTEPPSTPVRRGQQQGILTPRRQGVSTPSLLSKLNALKPTAKPILTPSKLTKTSVMQDLDKPEPLNLFATEDPVDNTELITPVLEFSIPKSDNAEPESWKFETTPDKLKNPFLESDSHGGGEEALLQHQKATDNDELLGGGSNDLGDTLDSRIENAMSTDYDPLEDDDDSSPSTPTRGAMERHASRGLSTSPLMKQLSDIDLLDSSNLPSNFLDNMLKSADEDDDETDEQSTPLRWLSSPSVPSNNQEDTDSFNPFEEASTSANIQLEFSPSPSPQKYQHHNDEVMDTTPVHTPIRELHQKDATSFPSTPPSAVRLALSRLSAQKIQGLPDLLQSPSTPLTTPSRPKLTLPLFDQNDDIEFKQGDTEGVDSTDEASNDKLSEQEKTTIKIDTSRRLSAPAGGLSHSPVLSSLRGVFRTPQKVVESCFAGFAGIRNFMSPSKSPSQKLLTEAAKENNIPKDSTGETASEVQDSNMNLDPIDNKENVFSGDSDEVSAAQTTPSKSNTLSSSGATPKGRLTSHQDAMSILLGHPQTPTPKSKEFLFAKEPSFLSPSKPLDQLKARGRLSDIFPQKRTVAQRSQSQNPEDRSDAKDGQEAVKDINGTTMRRRTITLLEFKGEGLISTPLLTLRSDVSQRLESIDTAETEVRDTAGEDEEDSGQAELLRILGEGADSADEDDEEEEDHDMEYNENKENIEYDMMEDAKVDAYLYGDDDAILDDKLKSPPRRTFLSDYNSTPTKRRLSFKKRLGSSSPAFRLYEQPNGEMGENDEDEDDMVAMISPKRVRVRNFLGGDC
ncbi:antigen identified by monoclonal antibody Ki-67 [Entomortierella beljakovae]|nr:antigen identified by monoclonal antibody Ki-67 [Entomortierella beljakovae]